MTSLPFEIRRRMRSLAEERLKPLCVELDADMKILSWWGNYTFYGFEFLNSGDDGNERFPFLIDLEIDGTLKIPFVDMDNGRAAHIDIFRNHKQYYVMFVDATEPRKRQRELQQKANELKLLAQQQNKLMQELEAARDDVAIKRRQAEEASAAKSRFISGMSHEFRTPLTAILGYIEFLRKHPDRQKRLFTYLSAIERGASHLLTLINNVLDQARLEIGEIVICPSSVDLASLAKDISAIFQPLAAQKKLNFDLLISDNLPSSIELDGVRLRQILINLIENALKFTDRGRVSVEMGWRENHLLAAVVDTGPGILEVDRQRIFEPFQSTNDHNNRGAGLGLYLSKRLAEMMGGNLSIESNPGKGSCFTLRLPAAKVQSESPDQYQTSSPQGPTAETLGLKGVILLAEDNDDIVKLVELFLTEAGYRVIIAPDGEHAVNTALRDKPDLVLMDLDLPIFDGFLATKQLRQLHFNKPIVALTASPSEKDRIRALEAGCNDYLLKPIDISRLLALIHELVHKKPHAV